MREPGTLSSWIIKCEKDEEAGKEAGRSAGAGYGELCVVLRTSAFVQQTRRPSLCAVTGAVGNSEDMVLLPLPHNPISILAMTSGR